MQRATRSRHVRVTLAVLVAALVGVSAVAATASSASTESHTHDHPRHTVPQAQPARVVHHRTKQGPSAAELKKQADIKKLHEAIWVDAVNHNVVRNVQYLRTAVYLHQVQAAKQADAARQAAARHAQARRVATTSVGTGRCGGNLPPCYIMYRESGGNIRAQNPRSSASGKWQFIDSTWAHFGGYARASDAPESVQDAKAAAMWAGGAGCSHWSAC